MVHCAVFGCSNNSKKKTKGVKFYSLPSNPELRSKWIVACRRQDKFNIQTAVVCSAHFSEAQKKKSLMNSLLGVSPKNQRNLVEDAVPDINLPLKSGEVPLSSRAARETVKARKRLIDEVLKDDSMNDCVAVSSETSSSTLVERPCDNIASSPANDNTTPAPMLTDVACTNDCVAAAIDHFTPVIVSSPGVTNSPITPEITDTPVIVSSPAINNSLITPEITDSDRMSETSLNLPPSETLLSSVPEQTSSSTPILTFQQLQGIIRRSSDLTGENQRLRAELKVVKKELKNSTEKDNCRLILSRYWSPGVVKKMMAQDPKKRIRWSADDIAEAISFRAVSARGYRYARNTIGLPLPSLSCLKAWARKLNLSPGILEAVLKMMEYRVKSMPDIQRVATLAFDEMHVSSDFCFDKHKEQVIGPHSKVQTVIVRGLFSKWKQVIFYDFDTKMSKALLVKIISKLKKIGITIVATVCDLGSDNQGLMSDLNITEELPYFHPFADKEDKVFVFCDAPHLLKCLRNHFIDHGYVKEKQTISKRCLVKIVSLESSAPEKFRDLKVSYKLDQTLFVKNLKRQNVGLAAKLISNTNAAAVRFLSKEGLIDDESSEAVAEFLQLFNDWFDLFNGTDQFTSYNGSSEQIAFLKSVSDYVREMRQISAAVDHKVSRLLPFQKGILITNAAVQGLLPYVQSLFPQSKLSYVVTRRLNQDIVENFFSTIRGMGGYNDHPSPLDFVSRLRWFILGKNASDAISTVSLNTKIDRTNNTTLTALPLDKITTNENEVKIPSNDKILLNPELFEDIVDCKPLTKHLLNPIFVAGRPKTQEENEIEDKELRGMDYEFEDLEGDLELEEISEPDQSTYTYNESRDFLAGYVAFRFKDTHQHLGTETFQLAEEVETWVTCQSKGRLREASKDFKEAIKVVDKVFLDFHGPSELKKEEKIFQKVLAKAKACLQNTNLSFDDKVLLCYIRTRTFIRLREWNRRLKSKSTPPTKITDKASSSNSGEPVKVVCKSIPAQASNAETRSLKKKAGKYRKSSIPRQP